MRKLATLFDGTRAHAVYTCQQSQFLANRLAASAGKPDCTSAFPRCAGQLVAKGKRMAARGTHMLTPLIDRLGRVTWSLTVPVTRSRTPHNRLFNFRALVLLQLLVSLKSCVVACSARIETDRQTDTHTQTHRPSTVTLAAHARRGLIT